MKVTTSQHQYASLLSEKKSEAEMHHSALVFLKEL